MSYIFISLHCFILLTDVLHIVQSLTLESILSYCYNYPHYVLLALQIPGCQTHKQLLFPSSKVNVKKMKQQYCFIQFTMFQFSMEKGQYWKAQISEASSMHIWGRIWRRTSTYHGTTLAEIRGPSWRIHRVKIARSCRDRDRWDRRTRGHGKKKGGEGAQRDGWKESNLGSNSSTGLTWGGRGESQRPN